MSEYRIVRRIGYAIPLVLAVVVAGTTAASRPPAPPTKGVMFNLVMKLRPAPVRGSAKPEPPTFLHGTGKFANGRGRIDIDSSTGPVAFSKGDYFVVDSGHTILVRPSVQTYTEIDSPIQNPLHQMVAAMANQRIVVSGVKVDMEKLGPTDSVGHMTTQHFRIQSEYALDLGTRQYNTQITTDMWVAKLPFRFVNPVEESMKSPHMPVAFNPLFDKIAAYSAQVESEGAAVKSVTTTTYAVGGMTWDTVQSAEITNVKEADVDEAAFRIPDRFRKGGH